ncbi:proto-oncogene Mas-like [Tiliqua scincoides]|uniref:proto-oncogene Mas-like n=1 Tax=Tiliqua scincoides TaxID=71010 RepID=UPI00346366C1
MSSFVLLISLFGLVGNGAVIWLLGVRMKRNPFTTYILNLSIADFGVLFSVNAAIFGDPENFNNGSHAPLYFALVFELFFFTFSTGQFLLVAISMDRCAVILFPLWHRCHRPPHLSTLVCSLIWILSFLLSGIHFTLFLTQSLGDSLFLYQLIVNALLCTPLMVLSTLTLFIKVCCKSASKSSFQHRGKLVTVILLTLLFFLLLAFPLNTIYAITYFSSVLHRDLMASSLICACLNSSVNPLIYFLVGGRQKKGQQRLSMKVVLQRVFKDDEERLERQA